MKYNCELIQDLLPLYHDKALSEVSNKIVEEHVQTCNLCKAYSEDIESNVDHLEEANKPPNINTTAFSKQVKRIRKILLTIFIVMILLLTAAVSFIIYLDLSETPSYTFTNYSEAHDLVEGGWIPSNIPTDASDIYVIYNLDSNVVNGSFELTKSARQSFMYTCTPVTSDQFSLLPQSLKSEWSDYKRLIAVKDESVSNLTLVQSDGFLFAISPSGYVLYWSK
jgi:hypothetical protein